MIIMLKISLKEILPIRMSDAEENPLEETVESGETEMEEDNLNYKEVENPQQKSKEDNMLAWREPQEEEEEEGEEGEETEKKEEEEEWEGWEEWDEEGGEEGEEEGLEEDAIIEEYEKEIRAQEETTVKPKEIFKFGLEKVIPGLQSTISGVSLVSSNCNLSIHSESFIVCLVYARPWGDKAK
jgi:hypothetical protein